MDQPLLIDGDAPIGLSPSEMLELQRLQRKMKASGAAAPAPASAPTHAASPAPVVDVSDASSCPAASCSSSSSSPPTAAKSAGPAEAEVKGRPEPFAEFEWVSNSLLDERSGALRPPTDEGLCKFYRGDRLRETMRFRLNTREVRGLTYHVTTQKKILGRFVVVNRYVLEMGDFEPGEHEFVCPSKDIPRIPGTQGRYKAVMTFKAEHTPEPLLVREAETLIC